MRALLLGLLAILTSCDSWGIREAYMALDSEGSRRRERFFTDTEEIFCIARMASGVEDLTLTATLRAQQVFDPRDGGAIDVDWYLAFEDEAPGAAEDVTVSIELERDDSDVPYLAGNFTCELSLQGELQEIVPFTVDFACPQAPITSGAPCAGFVIEGTTCPGAFQEICDCGSDGVWSCQ
jgi:hypothetical protein